VNQLDQMTQQNSALVEQSAAAADSLREQAHRLADVVQTFRLGDAAASPPPAATRPPASPAPRPAAPAAAKPKVSAPAAAPKKLAAPAPAPRPAPAPAAAKDDDWETF
jgi:methyl-accepting chemotaxis protein